MAGNVATTFTLGAVLGAGWVNSIGQAKKDISLLDRMSADLNRRSNKNAKYDSSRHEAAQKEVESRRAVFDAAKARQTADPKNKAFAKDVTDAKAAVRKAEIEVADFTKQLDAQRNAAFKAGLSIEDYRKRVTALAGAAAAMKTLSRSVEGFRQSWGNALTLLRNSAVQITGFITAQVALTGSVARSAEAIRIQAANLGMGTTAYQELAYVAGRAGVDNAAFDSAMRKLNLTLGKAGAGGYEARAAFSSLGLSLSNMLAMPVEARMDAIADSLKDVASETERAVLLQGIFGRDSAKMGEMLKGGAAQMRKTMQHGRDNSFTFSPADIERSKKFSQTLDDVKNAFMSIKTGAGLAIMEPLAGVLKEIGAFVNKNSAGIRAFFADLGTQAASLFRVVWRTTAAVGSFAGALLRLPGVLSAIVGGFAAIATATAAIRIGALVRDTYALAASLIRALPVLWANVAALRGNVSALIAKSVAMNAATKAALISARASLATVAARIRESLSLKVISAAFLTAARSAKVFAVAQLYALRAVGIAAWRGLAGAIGVVGGKLLFFSQAVGAAFATGGTLSAGVTALKFSLLGLKAAFAPIAAAIGAAVAAIGWPIIAIIAAVAALAAAVYFYWEPISEFFQETWAEIVAAFEPAIEAIKEAFAKVAAAWANLFPALKVIATVVFAPILATAYAIFKVMMFALKAVAWLVTGFFKLVKVVASVVGIVTGLVGGCFQWIIDTAVEIWDKLTSILPEWLVGKRDKKISISVNNTDKTAAVNKSGSGSAPALPVGKGAAVQSYAALPASATAPLSSAVNNRAVTVNNSPTITINTQPGQDTQAIAREVMRRLDRRDQDTMNGLLRDATPA